jgi:hypothetical protein
MGIRWKGEASAEVIQVSATGYGADASPLQEAESIKWVVCCKICNEILLFSLR